MLHGACLRPHYKPPPLSSPQLIPDVRSPSPVSFSPGVFDLRPFGGRKKTTPTFLHGTSRGSRCLSVRLSLAHSVIRYEQSKLRSCFFLVSCCEAKLSVRLPLAAGSFSNMLTLLLSSQVAPKNVKGRTRARLCCGHCVGGSAVCRPLLEATVNVLL